MKAGSRLCTRRSKDQIGHSTVALTADTYTSVLPETARTAAEHTVALLFPSCRSSAGAKRAAQWVRKTPTQLGHDASQAGPCGMTPARHYRSGHRSASNRD